MFTVLAKVVKQGALEEVSFTGNDGMQRQMKTMSLLLYRGSDSFAAEVRGSEAEELAKNNHEGEKYFMNLSFNAREKDGRFFQRVVASNFTSF